MNDDDPGLQIDLDEQQWEARWGEFFYRFDAWRVTTLVLLGLELVTVSVCAWRSWLWVSWKKVGPDAFKGSPDATYLYESCKQLALHGEWALLGVWICAVILLLATPRPNSSRLKGG